MAGDEEEAAPELEEQTESCPGKVQEEVRRKPGTPQGDREDLCTGP